ncbi:MAG: glycosyltransferase family 39 protein [Nitratireductor sp.]
MQADESNDGNLYWARLGIVMLAAILLVRIVSLWFNNTELFFDEAQYWAWGKEPAFGYFSKPPFLAWLIGATTAVLGDSEFAIRFASPVLHTATAAVIGLVASRLFDARAGFWSALVYATLPAVSLSSTVISTDVPLLFFWSVAILFFLRLEERDDIMSAAMLALAIGFGLLTKYAMIYVLPCAIVYNLLVTERPHLLGRPKFWMAIAGAFVIFLPNVIWNMQNSFATVGHTGENIGWAGGLHPVALAEFLGSQFGVMGPLLFGIFLAAIVRLPREGINRQQVFLLSFSVPILAIICFQALMSKAYANWAALTYVAATILVADLMLNRIPQWWLRVSMTLHAVVFAVLAIAVAFSQSGQLPLPEGVNPFVRMQGSREIAATIRKAADEGGYKAILSDNRRGVSLMTYYLRDTALPVQAWFEGGKPGDHFEMSRPWQNEKLEPVLYFTWSRNPADVVSSFIDAELVSETAIRQGEIQRIWLYRLAGYRGSNSQ